MDFRKCKDICDQDENCKFTFFLEFEDSNACRTYRSCESFQTTVFAGSIFSKEKKCPGIDII